MLPVNGEAANYREPPEAVDPVPEPAAQAGSEADVDEAPERRGGPVDSTQHLWRLDKVLVALAPEFSRSHLQHLIDDGHVSVDGATATTASRRVRAGQCVEVALVPTAESQAFRPQAMALDILFEDAHLLVIAKPAGLVVHPAPGNWSGTLLNGLLAHHALAATLPRAGIVHRLDKDTSGVMMVGKSLPAVTALVRALAAREVQRRYLALAQGVPARASFSVESPIGRDPVSRVRMAVVASGRPARTDVRVLESRAGVSALQCTLHTGRTHQIRVHLASLGHPLVGDVLYGGKSGLGLQRQALHAAELRLAHPLDGRALRFHGSPPPDFAAAWLQVATRAPD